MALDAAGHHHRVHDALVDVPTHPRRQRADLSPRLRVTLPGGAPNFVWGVALHDPTITRTASHGHAAQGR
jgi:hypothetical protein